MKKLYFVLISIIFLNSCDPNDGTRSPKSSNNADNIEMEENLSRRDAPMATEALSSRMMKSGPTSNFDQGNDLQKIITTGNLNIEVGDLEDFEEDLKSLLEANKAYITNQSQNNSDRRIDAYYTIRVPADNFEKLYNALKPFAKRIESQSLNEQDVTEQFIDVETRLKNRKALEARYLELLKQAKDLSDVLNIERQLNQVRSEIESQEGRLKYLNNQVGLSTIQLNAFEVKPYVYEPENPDNFGQRVLKSLENGWFGLVRGVIWFISLWPLWLAIIVIVVLFKRRKRMDR